MQVLVASESRRAVLTAVDFMPGVLYETMDVPQETWAHITALAGQVEDGGYVRLFPDGTVDRLIAEQEPPRPPPAPIARYQAAIRENGRTVEAWAKVVYAPQHQDDEGGPTIVCGVGEREGCVVEDIDQETLDRIHAAMPAHGGGVVLSADHQTATANPEPEAYRALVVARAQREEDDRALARLVAAHPDPVVRLLASKLGLPPIESGTDDAAVAQTGGG